MNLCRCSSDKFCEEVNCSRDGCRQTAAQLREALSRPVLTPVGVGPCESSPLSSAESAGTALMRNDDPGASDLREAHVQHDVAAGVMAPGLEAARSRMPRAHSVPTTRPAWLTAGDRSGSTSTDSQAGYIPVSKMRQRARLHTTSSGKQRRSPYSPTQAVSAGAVGGYPTTAGVCTVEDALSGRVQIPSGLQGVKREKSPTIPRAAVPTRSASDAGGAPPHGANPGAGGSGGVAWQGYQVSGRKRSSHDGRLMPLMDEALGDPAAAFAEMLHKRRPNGPKADTTSPVCATASVSDTQQLAAVRAQLDCLQRKASGDEAELNRLRHERSLHAEVVQKLQKRLQAANEQASSWRKLYLSSVRD